MKYLVIHPQDYSTLFLEDIYKNIPNAKVYRSCDSKKELRRQMENSDRIIMLGHGSPSGLFSVGVFDGGWAIDQPYVDILREKECVGIWCNCDKFFERYNLHGFYTGMFISEVYEAMFCGIKASKKEVDQQNENFAKLVGNYIKGSLSNLKSQVQKQYRDLMPDSEVVKYNSARFYYR